MENNEQLTFAYLLTSQISPIFKNTTKIIYEHLADEGIETTYRTIQRYKKGQMVPPFLTAKKILEAVNIKLEDKKLKEILEFSKETMREDVEKKSSPTFVRTDMNDETDTLKDSYTISLNINDLDFNASPEVKKEMLNERLINLYGEINLKKYIEDLIYNDLFKGE
jgi:ribosome-binding ATPase YchF (GTP1/OBG family)